MTLICSNCGNKHYVMTIPEIIQAVREGWRAVGGAEYCPKCVKTWKDRNDQEIPTDKVSSYWKIRALMPGYFE